ncbi:hypothetical protein HIMB100_00003950 [SAR116 cluster alpha proteobacterium HIMB100]|nr:hypothetical protein HIMB100_00003950 [SAR116 cluster alpha proteobacterium HIMB100]
MLKALILAILIMFVLLILLRRIPAIRTWMNNLLRQPLVRSILFQGLWRLIRFLIFRR